MTPGKIDEIKADIKAGVTDIREDLSILTEQSTKQHRSVDGSLPQTQAFP